MAEQSFSSVDLQCAAASVARVARLAIRTLEAPAALALLRLARDRVVVAGAGLLPATPAIDPNLLHHLVERDEEGRWRWQTDARASLPHSALRAALAAEGVRVRHLRGAPAVAEDGSLVGVVITFDDATRGGARGRESLALLAEVLAGVHSDLGERAHGTAAPVDALDAHARETLASAARASATGLAVIDDEGRIRAADEAFARLTGASTPDAVVGRHLTSIGLPASKVGALLARVLGDCEAVEEELDLYGGSGPPRVALRLAAAPRREPSDRLVTLLLDDVSSVRSLSAQLEASRERLRLLERATNDVIWEWDIDAGTVVWNDAGAKQFRFVPEEVRAEVEWHVSRIHPEDREHMISGLQAIVAGIGDVWSGEYRFRRGDESYAWILNRACVVRNGRSEPMRVVGWMVDVSERKRAEEAQRFLSRAGALLDAGLSGPYMLESIARHCVPEFGDCCVIDLAGERGESVHMAMAHASAPEERQMRDWIRDTGHAATDGPVRRALRSGESLLVADAIAGDGSVPEHALAYGPVRLASYMIVPIRARGRVLGAITFGATNSNRRYHFLDLMVAEELSQRIALALENAHLYETARRALRDRQEVLGLVSHDLKTPLSSIMLTASLLREDAHIATEEGRRRADAILDAARQMSTLIGDLLDVSRIEAGHFTVHTTLASPAELVERTTALFAPLVADKEISLHVELPDDLRQVVAESDQVARVLSNLLGNALKFTPRGGAITIRAAQRPNDVLFSVDDTGPGLTAEQIAHVFQPFWSAGGGTEHGSGLGLAIAQGIVDAHGGKLWVDRGWTRGSRFVFTLPCQAASAERMESALA